MTRNLLRAGPILFLVFPFLFLIWHFPVGAQPEWGEIAWAAKNTFWQAAGSATLCMVLGLWGALGLVCFSSEGRNPLRSGLEILLLAPNFLPAIFTLIATLNIVDPFPMGLPGIVLVHTLMNWGLVAVLIAGLIEDKVGGLAEISVIEGTSRRRFIFRALLPMLRKDLMLLWLFVFSICFGSFGVPLVVGGGRGTTLEVLIYEKIRLSSDWSQAVFIALLQSLFLFALAWFAARGRTSTRIRRARLSLIEMKTGVALILFGAVFLIFGYLQGFPSGWRQMGSLQEMTGDLFRAFEGSMVVGLGCGFLCLLLLMLLGSLVPCVWFEKFLSGYVAPSSALTSFAFLVLTPNESFWPYIKIPFALALLTVPVLWKMGWQGQLEGIQRQREIAETLGASPFLAWKEVVLPQVAPLASTLAGIAAVWACGDFAVSRILSHHDLTLALMTETLMTSGYRLGLATILSPGIFIAGLLCFFILKGAGRVLSRKPRS